MPRQIYRNYTSSQILLFLIYLQQSVKQETERNMTRKTVNIEIKKTLWGFSNLPIKPKK